MTGAPGGSRNTQAAGPEIRGKGRARAPRGEQAKRRTTRDNPEGAR
jgi:hypothetical protein